MEQYLNHSPLVEQVAVVESESVVEPEPVLDLQSLLPYSHQGICIKSFLPVQVPILVTVVLVPLTLVLSEPVTAAVPVVVTVLSAPVLMSGPVFVMSLALPEFVVSESELLAVEQVLLQLALPMFWLLLVRVRMLLATEVLLMQVLPLPEYHILYRTLHLASMDCHSLHTLASSVPAVFAQTAVLVAAAEPLPAF